MLFSGFRPFLTGQKINHHPASHQKHHNTPLPRPFIHLFMTIHLPIHQLPMIQTQIHSLLTHGFTDLIPLVTSHNLLLSMILRPPLPLSHFLSFPQGGLPFNSRPRGLVRGAVGSSSARVPLLLLPLGRGERSRRESGLP